MPFLDSNHQRAAILITLLGVAVAIALAPYASGLLGAPVLYVILHPVHAMLARRMPASLAAVLVIVLTIVLVVVPGVWLVGVLVGEAQGMARSVLQSPVLDRIAEFQIGTLALGPQLARAGEQVISWLGGNALGLIGTATRFILNLTFSFFGLYYLLLHPDRIWEGVEPYIPFSGENTRRLQQRFRDVTASTIIGTGVIALLQGGLLGIGFAIFGLANPLFWGVVTAVFAILPVVGSGLIWGPAVIAMVLEGRTGAALGLGLWSAILVINVDNVIRPVIYNKYAKIHPLVTLVGAVAGVSYLGLLGLLIGPLALSYFFEVIGMYRREYFAPVVGEAPEPGNMLVVPGSGSPDEAPPP